MEISDLITAESNINDYKLKVGCDGFWLGYMKSITKQYRISGSLKTGFGEALLVNDKLKQL